jgi:hypothetical protein
MLHHLPSLHHLRPYPRPPSAEPPNRNHRKSHQSPTMHSPSDGFIGRAGAYDSGPTEGKGHRAGRARRHACVWGMRTPKGTDGEGAGEAGDGGDGRIVGFVRPAMSYHNRIVALFPLYARASEMPTRNDHTPLTTCQRALQNPLSDTAASSSTTLYSFLPLCARYLEVASAGRRQLLWLGASSGSNARGSRLW